MLARATFLSSEVQHQISEDDDSIILKWTLLSAYETVTTIWQLKFETLREYITAQSSGADNVEQLAMLHSEALIITRSQITLTHRRNDHVHLVVFVLSLKFV